MAVLLEKDTLVNELVNTLVEGKDGDRGLVLNKESSLTLSLLFPQAYIEAMNFVDGFLVLPTPGTGGINTDGHVIDSASVIDKDGGSESANQEQRCGGDRLNQLNQVRLVRFPPMELCVVAGAEPASGETAGEHTFSTAVNIPRRSVVCDVGEWFCSCDSFAAGCWDVAPGGRAYCPHLLSLLILESHRDKFAVRAQTLGGGVVAGPQDDCAGVALQTAAGKQAFISQISETNAQVAGWIMCNASLWPGQLTASKPASAAEEAAAGRETARSTPEK